MAGKAMASLDFAGAGFLESLCRTPVCLDLGHLLLLWLSIETDDVLFFWRNDDEHAATFHFWSHLNVADVLQLGNETIESMLAKFHMRDFPAPEHDGNLCLVAFLDKAPRMLDFELQVMFVSLGSELNFLQLDLDLLLFRLLQLLALLILEFAVVHDAANRRNRRG